jgi:indole-3-glycerol phosphate synthase
LLETIVAATRRIVEVREEREPMTVLARRAARRSIVTGRFRAALARPNRLNVIAECKRRSPSAGVLRRDYDATAIARAYEEAGAAAVSVLTEPTFFDGSLGHLQAVREAVDIPILRKDFIVSEYQLLEAKAGGADAVLLIVAALQRPALARLVEQAQALGLEALVEVHGETELDIAVDVGASIIGVNNRNLRTLELDATISESLITRMPADVIAVSESGLKSAADLVRLRDLGYAAFLIGGRLITAPRPGEALAELLR